MVRAYMRKRSVLVVNSNLDPPPPLPEILYPPLSSQVFRTSDGSPIIVWRGAVTTVPLAVGYGALNLSVRSLDR